VALPDSASGYLTSSAFPAIVKLLAGKDAVAVGPGLDPANPGPHPWCKTSSNPSPCRWLSMPTA